MPGAFFHRAFRFGNHLSGFICYQESGKIRGEAGRERAQLLRRAKATQRLQGCDRLSSRRMAADAGRKSDFSVLRNSELGRASCRVTAHYRISRGDDSGLGV